MKFYTAIQAAERLGKSEKTIRRWIQDGRLKASHPMGMKNKLAITEKEVERLQRELAEYEDTQQVQPDTSEHTLLLARIAQLETLVQELVERVTAVENRHVRSQEATSITPHSFAVEPATQDELPAGVILAKDFAERYGVNRRTFEDHIRKGIGGERVQALERPKPNRPKETERWLTPDQQETTLAFWKRHGVKFTVMTGHEVPVGYVSLTQFFDLHAINRNSGRQAIKMGFVHAEGKLLSPNGQRETWVQFHTDAGFRSCDSCPHAVVK